ncbi:hypothetical protein ScPMuIL_000262, partial [Solemya velum]
GVINHGAGEEEFRGLHLKFLFKHRSSSDAKDKSEKNFAMSFVKLVNKNGTTLEDTLHDILVYKIENKKDAQSGPYLDLPATKKDLESQGIQQGSSKVPLFSGPYTLSSKDFFQIETFVCSTKLTHNVALLGLLKWQEMLNDTAKLQVHLEQLMMVEGEEIVKFLQDLLDSLFGILMQESISESHGNLVFDALVYIISLISDRKYHQFRPVLDDYIVRSFSFATAYDKLMLILKDYVDEANETLHEQSLKRAMKSLEYIFKFIVKSRHHFSRINQDRGKQQFEITLQQLLKAIGGMMMYTTHNTLVVQGAALKYMSTTIPDIVTVYDLVELSQLMVEFVNNVPEDRLKRQKMKFIDDLVHSPLFKDQSSRQVLLPVMLHHTKSLMTAGEELEDCVLVLGDIMDTLWSPDKSTHDKELTLIMQMTLRSVIQTAIGMERASKLTSKCVALLLSVFRQMTESHYKAYISNFPTLIDLQDFLAEILLFFRDLIPNNVFSEDWMEMILLQNSIILRSLRFFANTVKEMFSGPFEPQLWTLFFQCAVCFLTQKPLQLERFSVTKRQKIVDRYKDMRRETAFEIRSMWFNLGPNRKHFIPDMVGLIMEMTLVPETELRKATIPIFFDMMQCEFMQPTEDSRKIKENFIQVEDEIISQLDTQVEGGQGDEQYMELIFSILHDLCDGHSTMRKQGLSFVEKIRELLQQLLEYRHAIQDEMKEYKMSCIVNLLNFYKKIQRQEMYVRYLHKLCDLHLECDNYTEAAYTLMLYVDLLQWSDDVLPVMLKSNKYPDAQTNRELKEQLYYDIISYFDKGKMWEVGIKLCKELAKLYEDELFDYERLSTILKRQADMYDCIMKEMRPDPEYFRVGYYGKDFPSFLQNKVFIFRGKEYERLSDFSARMQTLFPNAELLKTLGEPSLDVKNSKKQYLQINAVTPVLELQEKFLNKPVSEKILKYYAVNEVQKFIYSRRLEESGNDVASMWLERTTLETVNPFPGILCWFPVQNIEKVNVSPLENAVDTLEMTNKRLSGEIEQLLNNPSLEIKGLGMMLNGVVDPSVNGGIANYKPLISDRQRREAFNLEMIPKLKEVIAEKEKEVLDLGKLLENKTALLTASRKTSKEYKDQLRRIEQNDAMVESLQEELKMSKFEIETLKLLMTGKDQLVMEKCRALDKAKVAIQSVRADRPDSNRLDIPQGENSVKKSPQSQQGIKMVRPLVNGQPVISRTANTNCRTTGLVQTGKTDNHVRNSLEENDKFFKSRNARNASPDRNEKFLKKVINDTYIPLSARPRTAVVHPISRSAPQLENSPYKPQPLLQRPSQKCLQILTSRTIQPVKYQSTSRPNSKYTPSLNYVVGLNTVDNLKLSPRGPASLEDCFSETSGSDSILLPSDSTNLEETQEISDIEMEVAKLSEMDRERLLSDMISVGNRVRVDVMEKAPKTYGRRVGPQRKTYCGIVKFVGPLDHDKGTTKLYTGIRLDDLSGDTDGMYNGKQYMYTASKQGKFFRVKNISSVLDVKIGQYVSANSLIARAIGGTQDLDHQTTAKT